MQHDPARDDAVELHHDMDRAMAIGGHVATLTAIVHVADVLALRVAERTDPDKTDEATTREDRAVAFLELVPEDLLARWDAFRRAGDGWGERAKGEATSPRREAASPSPVPCAPTEPVRTHAKRTPLLLVAITLALAASGIIAVLAMR